MPELGTHPRPRPHSTSCLPDPTRSLVLPSAPSQSPGFLSLFLFSWGRSPHPPPTPPEFGPSGDSSPTPPPGLPDKGRLCSPVPPSPLGLQTGLRDDPSSLQSLRPWPAAAADQGYLDDARRRQSLLPRMRGSRLWAPVAWGFWPKSPPPPARLSPPLRTRGR